MGELVISHAYYLTFFVLLQVENRDTLFFMTWALCYLSLLFDEISILVGSCAAVLG